MAEMSVENLKKLMKNHQKWKKKWSTQKTATLEHLWCWSHSCTVLDRFIAVPVGLTQTYKFLLSSRMLFLWLYTRAERVNVIFFSFFVRNLGTFGCVPKCWCDSNWSFVHSAHQHFSCWIYISIASWKCLPSLQIFRPFSSFLFTLQMGPTQKWCWWSLPNQAVFLCPFRKISLVSLNQ